MTKRRKARKSRARQEPAKPVVPTFNGDHGTGTRAANMNTTIEKLEGPNNFARRRRVSAIEEIKLEMPEMQAARAIVDAWCRLKMLESGGPLKERVDASPKPDAVIDRQVEAQARWLRVTRALLRSERRIVEWVCCENMPIETVGRMLNEPRAHERFRQAMRRVAMDGVF